MDCELNQEATDPGSRSSNLRQEVLRRRCYGCTQPPVSRSCCESGGETFVAVMQAGDFWDGDDLSELAWHDPA